MLKVREVEICLKSGLTQLTKIVTLDTGSAEEILKNSKKAREVYVKASKGMKMVRKFMLWKTNKEHSHHLHISF
jgi:hypothetical protein